MACGAALLNRAWRFSFDFAGVFGFGVFATFEGDGCGGGGGLYVGKCIAAGGGDGGGLCIGGACDGLCDDDAAGWEE